MGQAGPCLTSYGSSDVLMSSGPHQTDVRSSGMVLLLPHLCSLHVGEAEQMNTQRSGMKLCRVPSALAAQGHTDGSGRAAVSGI